MNEFELLIKDITLYSSSKLLSFNSKLVNSKFDIIGLSIPHIKKIAKKNIKAWNSMKLFGIEI